MPDKIQLNLPFILLILLLFTAAAIAWYFYHRTVPEIKPWMRYLLSGLRIAALFSLLLLLFAPKLIFTFYIAEKPRMAVFIDNSRSMGVSNGREARWTAVKAAAEKLQALFPESEQTHWYQFNSQTARLSGDTLRLSSGGTNFSAARKQIVAGNYETALILSDGNNTEGNFIIHENATLQSSIITIGVGQASGAGDVFISDVEYQPVVYQGQTQQIKARVGAAGLSAGSVITAQLRYGEKIAQTKTMRTDTTGAEQTLVFEYTPQHTGLNRLQIIVEEFPGEENTLNNSRAIIQDVLKNKLRIAVLASMAGYESKFLRQILNENPDFECQLLIEDQAGQFLGLPAPPLLDSLDVAILQDYPTANSSASVLSALSRSAARKSLICFISGRMRLDRLNKIIPALPFRNQLHKNLSADAEGYIPSELSGDALLNLFGSDAINRRYWTKLPPVTVWYPDAALTNPARALLKSSIRNREFPVIILAEQPQQRLVFFNGLGFWKWHFELQHEAQLNRGYANLLTYLLRWVTGSKRLKPVMLEIPERVAHLGERLKLSGYMYDAQFQPIRNGSLQFSVTQNGQDFTIPAETDSGRFRAEFTPRAEGRYRIRAEGQRDGRIIGQDEIEIEVIPFEKELIRFNQNVSFLKDLAEATQGFYIPATQIDSLRQKLPVRDKIVEQQEDIELWRWPLMLIIILGFIIMEWVLRKRFGLV